MSSHVLNGTEMIRYKLSDDLINLIGRVPMIVGINKNLIRASCKTINRMNRELQCFQLILQLASLAWTVIVTFPLRSRWKA